MQTYFDIPLGDALAMLPKLWSFLNVTGANTWPKATIEVGTIGSPRLVHPLEFSPRQGRNNRYRINNQARQKTGNNRHPAWAFERGFPQAPDNCRSKEDSRMPDVTNLRIYIVKTLKGNFYAGFVNEETMPASWPKHVGLERLFSTAKSAQILEYGSMDQPQISPLARRVLDTWRSKKNVLLYGPPGTGKTFIMQQIWTLLGVNAASPQIEINPEDSENPFIKTDVELPFPGPIRREWVTFHQNLGYESFVIGLFPQSEGTGFKLVPRAGTLLDSAISIDGNLTEEPFSSAVIYIDEINRGNVSKIFGEFITFMEDDYRADHGDASLPVPLHSIKISDGKTELIERSKGPALALPSPWFFPQNVFILASMNSVDRAVAPLDTALARRFARIEVGPDLNQLAEAFNIVSTEVLSRITPRSSVAALSPESSVDDSSDGLDEDTLVEDPSEGSLNVISTALETAWLLLYRLNYELAAALGPDFELGHTYMYSVRTPTNEDDRFVELARVWDQSIYPQLQERYSSRPSELHTILRVGIGMQTPRGYLIVARQRPITAGESVRSKPIYVMPSLEQHAKQGNLEQVKITLRYLAGL